MTDRTPLRPEQQELVRAALPIVDRVAGRLPARYRALVDRAELIAAGHEGLVQAATAFDAALGVPFALYATYRVEGAMLDVVRKEVGIRQHVKARMAACEYLAVQRDTGNVMTDTDADVHRQLDSFADGLAATMFVSYASQTASLRPEREGEDAVAARDEYARAVEALRNATSTLPERERRLIEMHYVEERDLKEVAKELGVSYASVRRYHANVMERLAIRLRTQGITSAPS